MLRDFTYGKCSLYKITYVKLIWPQNLSKNFLRLVVLMKKSVHSMEKTLSCNFNITFSTTLNSCQHLPPSVRTREKNTHDLQNDVKKTYAALHLWNFSIKYYTPHNGVDRFFFALFFYPYTILVNVIMLIV